MYIDPPRMIIRVFIPEDAADLQEILGDGETMKNCEPAYDFEKTKEFLTSFCIGRNGAVAAVYKESGKMMGYILFNEFDEGVYEAVNLDRCTEMRTSLGGPAFENVRAEAARVKSLIK